MIISSESLRGKYESMSNDEMIDLYNMGTLTENANLVLVEMMVERSVNIPEKPYLLFGFFGKMLVANILYGIYFIIRRESLLNIISVLISAYLLFASIVIWRCSVNSKSSLYRMVVRGESLFFIMVFMALFVAGVNMLLRVI